MRTHLNRVFRRAKYAAIGAAIGAGIGGILSRNAATTGASVGALVGATVAEEIGAGESRIEAVKQSGEPLFRSRTE